MVSIADVTDPKSIGPRIRMMKPHLTPLEAKVVDSVMARRDFSHETSLKEVADDAGVSEAMVVKIAKKLGFAGYRDFRQNVVDYARASVGGDAGGTLAGRQPARIVNKVFQRLYQALEETLAIADIEATIALRISSPELDNATSTGSAAQPRSPATSRQVPPHRRPGFRLR